MPGDLFGAQPVAGRPWIRRISEVEAAGGRLALH